MTGVSVNPENARRSSRRQRLAWRLRFAQRPAARVGVVVGIAVVLIAIFGPFFSPYGPTQTIGVPYSPSSSMAPLGTDIVGRDVLSRLLWGGRSVLLLGVSATIIAYLIAIPVGLFTGYTRSRMDGLIMRGVDVLLAIPPLLFLLVVAAGAGPSKIALVLAVGIVLAPMAIRVIRAATLEISVTGYVEAAIARGDGTFKILRREILPNISGILLADLGLRLTWAILLVASMNFLGLGLQPPAADWGLMITENRSGLASNPLVIAAPAAMIACLTISVNLVADALARTLGSSREQLAEVGTGPRGALVTDETDSAGLLVVDTPDATIDPVTGVEIAPEVASTLPAAAELPNDVSAPLADADVALVVNGLGLELTSGGSIVKGVSFRVRRGEIYGIVGESGSGKTSTALALLGFARPGVDLSAGSVTIDGQELLHRSESDLRPLRGKLVSYVPQEPAGALNPSLRIGQLIDDLIRQHEPAGSDTSEGRVGLTADALDSVGLPSTRDFLRRFPHQLSGGQQQRVALAMALVCRPRLIVLDEPTTGLDVVTQVRVLDEIRRLRAETDVAMVYVSHDLGIVASLADRVSVMYAGRIVEEGLTQEVLIHPKHPYTAGLVAAIPDVFDPAQLIGIPGSPPGVYQRLPGCEFAPRCALRTDRCTQEIPALQPIGAERDVRCFEWQRTEPLVRQRLQIVGDQEATKVTPTLVVDNLHALYRGKRETVTAASDVSLAIAPGESVALVGESGSGKSTIARCIAGLHEPTGGSILLDGEPLAARAKDRSREQRRRCQIIFQNSRDALNPRQTVRSVIASPLQMFRGLTSSQAEAEVYDLLDRVRLPRRVADRFPLELSGGERQRVAIARALGAQPQIVICDEITSALDVSVQAAVLELLAELRAELKLSMLFISHDLGVVATVADRTLVLEKGLICDQGPMDALVNRSTHPYTRRLIQALSESHGSESVAGPVTANSDH